MKKQSMPLSDKAIHFRCLSDIMAMAVRTGEYREPGFRAEVYDIVDDIFADEIGQIRMVAAYERALLQRDIEIIHLKTLREIDQRVAEMERKVEAEIRRIFAELAQRPAFSPRVPDLNAPIYSACRDLDRRKSESQKRMGEWFTQIIGQLKI